MKVGDLVMWRIGDIWRQLYNYGTVQGISEKGTLHVTSNADGYAQTFRRSSTGTYKCRLLEGHELQMYQWTKQKPRFPNIALESYSETYDQDLKIRIDVDSPTPESLRTLAKQLETVSTWLSVKPVVKDEPK
jgi:hypothetical protein